MDHGLRAERTDSDADATVRAAPADRAAGDGGGWRGSVGRLECAWSGSSRRSRRSG